jgi:signal transduction histidine kinase
MQERVSALGGQLSLSALPGGGLRVQVVLPVLPAEDAP